MVDLNKPKFQRHVASRPFSRREEFYGCAGCLGVIALALGALFLCVLFLTALFKGADALLSWAF